MSNGRHKNQTPDNGGVHGIISFKYANSTVRLAATGFDPVYDIYKAAIDLDSGLIWIITSVSGGLASWQASGTGGGLVNISAGATSNNLTNFILSNSNNVSFGLSGSTITGSASFAQTVQTQSNIQGISAGTTSANTGNVVFSNSNGISFGMSGNTITATVIPGAAAGIAANQAGTQTATSGTVVFANSNGLTFGMSGSSQITASYTVPSTAGLLSNVNVSAGTTSNNLSAFVFSNSNNVSFGLNGSTVTATITVPAQTNQSVGLYALGNTTQNSSTTLDARSLSFNGLGAATVGYSNGSIQVSVPTQTAQTQSNIQGIYDGANSISTGTIRFTNANGVSFSINGQTISGSVAAQTNQSVGLYALGNTTQNSSTTLDARTLSFNGLGAATVGYSNGSIQISVPTQTAQTQSLIQAVYDGVNSITTGTIRFTNANGVSFSINGQTISGSVAAQTNQTAGLYAVGNTTAQSSSSTFDARSLSFQGTGGVSVGYSNGSIVISGNTGGGNGSVNISAGTTSNNLTNFVFSNSNNVSFGLNGSTVTATITVPAQTNQSVGFYALGNTTQNSSTTLDARTLSFNGLGAATVGYSNGSIQISVPTQTAQTQSLIQAIYDGVNSITTGTIRFTNANGVSFSINGQTISGSVAAQTNQTAGLYAVGNTTGQSSSSTFDARTLSFSGAGIASVGYSAGNVVISVPSAGALINVSAGTTSNNLGAVTFSNSNNVSFGLNGSTITASIPNQTIGLYALGNTTQNSSTTLDARTLSFNGLGIITAGYSNGSIQISATQSVQTQSLIQAVYDGANSISTGTIRFTNANGVSFSINGQTISGSVAAQTAQTVGLYALGNTTQNSSTTLDARTLSFNGLGAASVGYSNGSIQISVPNALTNVNISAGTTSNNLTAFVFSNSNNVSFGLNGSTVTATITVPAQTNQSVGLYALGNTTQNSSTTLDARTLSFNGLGAATVGYSNGSIQISVPTQTAQTQSNIQAIYDGANSISTGTIRFTNANGVSFSVNGQTISGSVAAQTAQTVGLYALGNTTQNSSTTLDARTLSFNGLGAASVGYSNGSIQISVPNALTNVNISAGTTSNNLTAFVFSNSNNVSFGLNGSTVTATITVPAQTNQSIGLYALGNTTQNSSTTLDARTLSFNGLGAATVGYSNGSIQISVPTQTAQTQSLIQAIYDGANSITTGTIRFTNANGVSFSINGQTISGSVAAQTVQTVGLYALGNTTQNSSTTLDARTLSFNGLGIVTAGYSNGSIQISATQSAQTAGLYAVGNTVGQSSSSTFDARTMSFSGAGIASVGYSAGNIVISVPTAGAQVNISAGTTSNNLGAVTFSNSNNVSFGLNGSTITASIPNQTIGLYALGNTTQNSSTTLDARTLSFNGLGAATLGYSNGSIQVSVPVQTNQTAGLYAVGNTTGQSSSSTFDARTMSFSGAGIASVGYSAGNVIISVPSAGALVNISAGTTSNNLGAVTFSNSNNVSFGLNGSTITASIPNQTIGLYALGNTTQNSSTTLDARTLSFNGLGIITAGYSNGSIQISATQSVQTQSLIAGIYDGANSISTGTIRFTNANGVSFSINGQTISGSVAAQTVQTVGLYALGNTTQNSSTTLDARTLSFNGLGAASVGYSNGSIQISVPNALTNVNISAGTTSNNLTAFVFSNSNNVSFGLNGSTVTATITVPAQTNQSVGLYALGNTTQNSSTTLDARTLSFNGLGAATVGYSNGSIQISVPTQTAQTQSLIAGIYDGANSISTGTIRFTNANGVSFSINGQTISGSVAAQTAQTIGLYALGNTTQNSSTTLDARTLSFNGLGAATVGYSNGSIQISVPNALTNVNISAGTTSNNLTAFVFSNSNNVSFGLNGSTVTATITVPAQTAQTVGLYALGNTTQNSSTTLDARTLSFNGLGIITAGYSNGSIQISATQSAQSIGLYALGNTTQNSSTTLDARTLSFNGLGAATVGYSNGSIQVSVPVQTAQTQSNIQGIYDGANSISTGTIRFTNANGVSFSINGQTISGSVAAQTNQTIGLYAVSNTTGASSSSTADARSLSFQGAGIASVGYTNGSVVISVPSGGGGITNVNVSAGTTSNNLSNFVFSNSNSVSFGLNGSTITASIQNQTYVFSNSNNISFGVNGSTITASVSRPQVSQLIYPEVPWQTNFLISNASFSLQHFNAKIDILATQANLLMALTGNTNSSGALTVSLGIYTMSGSTMSLASSDSRALTWTSGSQSTNSTIYGGISGTRYRTVALNSWSVTAGDYILGMWFRTTNNGTWNAFGIQGPTIVGAVDANETNHYLNGYSTSSYTTAMIASANVTDTNYVRTGGNAFQQPGIIFMGSY